MIQTVNFSFSGGGARGSFQAGVFDSLLEQGIFRKVYLGSVSGVSAGALNGAFVAEKKSYLLQDLWIEGAGKWFYLLGRRFIDHCLRAHLTGEPSVPFVFNLTELATGEYHVLSRYDFDDVDQYVLGLRASASPPVWPYFKAVKKLWTKDGCIKNAADGGICERFLVPDFKDETINVLIDTQSGIKDTYAGSNTFRQAFTALSLTQQHLDTEITEDLPPNTIRIRPPQGIGARHDFRQKTLIRNYELGLEAGKKLYQEIVCLL